MAREKRIHSLITSLPPEAQERIKHFTSRNKVTVYVILSLVAIVTAGALVALALFAALYYTGVFRDSGISTMWWVVIVVSVVLVVSTILSNIIARTVLEPVKEMAAVMHLVEEGDFSVRMKVPPKTSPMHGVVGRFNTMMEELSANEMFRRDFINTFSHEFKTPIVSIRGFAKQMVEDTALSDDEKTEYAKIILAESERLAGMSTNILLLSKFETQNMITDACEFSLDEQIRHCILLFEKQWTAKNINLSVDLEEINFFSNEETLSHIWINLINNAIKFSEQDGDISITLKRSDNSVIFRISDDGCGMNEDTCKHIFEKFYQADTSHSKEGNGLGLSLCGRIVTLAGGHISVDSIIGAGSTFTVTLPEVRNDRVNKKIQV